MSASRSIAVPRLLDVGPGVLDGLEEALAQQFDPSDVLVVSGHDTSRTFGQRLADGLERLGSRVRSVHGPDGTLAGISRWVDTLGDDAWSLVIGVGGGRPIDVAKVIATRLDVDLVAVPTVLSHDGMCSPVASLVAADGVRTSLGTTTPAGVVVDTTVVGMAPARYLRAGIGDLISNLTAVQDWHLAAQAGHEQVDEFAASMALLSARSAFDISWPPSEADLGVIARALVMSGLAMGVAGSSRPCSGGEHLISHALDELRGCHAAIHGEQVALGALITANLQGADSADHLRTLFERIGFPTDLEGWGLDPAMLVQAIRHAPSTRPGRHTVLDESDLSETAVEELVKSVFDRHLA